MVAELGRHDPAGAVMALEVVPDEGFGKVIAVTLGRVEQVDAGSCRLVEDGICFALREGPSPFAPELPGAKADNGNLQAGAAEGAVFHREVRCRKFHYWGNFCSSRNDSVGEKLALTPALSSRRGKTTLLSRVVGRNMLPAVLARRDYEGTCSGAWSGNSWKRRQRRRVPKKRSQHESKIKPPFSINLLQIITSPLPQPQSNLIAQKGACFS